METSASATRGLLYASENGFLSGSLLQTMDHYARSMRDGALKSMFQRACHCEILKRFVVRLFELRQERLLTNHGIVLLVPLVRMVSGVQVKIADDLKVYPKNMKSQAFIYAS